MVSSTRKEKHAKSYRQISLILAKIPSRDAYPSDIFNIHASILERSGKLKSGYFSGSITAFPIIIKTIFLVLILLIILN